MRSKGVTYSNVYPASHAIDKQNCVEELPSGLQEIKIIPYSG